ncbi:MAG: hypothetical protein EOO20_05890 [Chryseobacterium sp.]|nr:MAG: hypothetical protein EOO20_05890 [Chryseobacterium sp.]
MLKTKDTVLAGYQNHVAIQENLLRLLKSKLNTISFSRLGLFLLEILLVALIINFGFSIVYGILLILPLIAFMYLVKRQIATQKLVDYHTRLLWVFNNEIGVMGGEANGYTSGQIYEDESHQYASDLDIFGRGSLYALVNRCSTENGQSQLAVSLGGPHSKGIIMERQEANHDYETGICMPWT